MVLPALREKNLAKIEEENDKKCVVLPCQVRERRKVEKLFEKDVLKQSKNCFKKPEIRSLIDRKTGLINQTRQRLTEFLKQDFDWSKNRLDQSKFWKKKKKNSFWEKKPEFLKTYLKALNITKQMHGVWDEMLSQNTSFKPNFPKKLILNNLPQFLKQQKQFLHKTQSIFQTSLVRS